MRQHTKLICLLFFIFSFGYLYSQEQNILPGNHTYKIGIEDLIREYVVHIPQNYYGKTALPLVIVFHGGGGRAEGTMQSTGWIEKSEQAGFIAVYPEGSREHPDKPWRFRGNGQTWNDGSERINLGAIERNVDDLFFIEAMLLDIFDRFPIDRQRVFATGFSNGASMTFRVAGELSQYFAAVAPVAGGDWLESPAPEFPLSLLYITGSVDPLNPLEGGEVRIGWKTYGIKQPVMEMLQKWVIMQNCSLEEKSIVNSNGVKGAIYSNCSGGSEVSYYIVEGLGHVWPGGESRLPEWLVGEPSDKLDGTEVIWEFFEEHARKKQD